jgi:hypothetical protein
MKKILEIFRQDRLLHFLVGFLTYYVSSFFLNPLYSFGVVFAIALAKEIRDGIQDGNDFDIVDFYFTIIPAILLFLKN